MANPETAKKITLFLVLLAFTATPEVWSAPVYIDTPLGILLGSQAERVEDVDVFKGIPYAVPPIGHRRWATPESAPAWQGDRDATAFGPACMQPGNMPREFVYYSPAPLMSEDCLYLNVWTPAHATSRKDTLPVMVWIHGGSLLTGAGSQYDGADLAAKGVVVVTINYRLGIMGYFSHPELTANSPVGAFGNYGTMDQILALKWVRDNIAAFGGNPDNVTIFGQSAGALSVSHLLASPLAKGLFHRAIAQSTYALPMKRLKVSTLGLSPAEKSGTEIEKKLGVNSIAQLRRLAASHIYDVVYKNGFLTPEPTIDGYVFHEQIFETFERQAQHDVPILFGFNGGEGYHTADGYSDWVAVRPKNKVDYKTAVQKIYGELSKEYLAQYPADNLDEVVFAPLRDGFWGWATEKYVQAMDGLESEAYLYYYNTRVPWEKHPHRKAYHAAEIVHVFNQSQYVKDGNIFVNMFLPNLEGEATQLDVALSDLISDYWVSFARSGKPTAKNGPDWRPYKENARHYMAFADHKARPGTNLLPGMLELTEKIIQRRRALALPWVMDLGLMAPVLK